MKNYLINYLKKQFELTQNGATSLVGAIWSAFMFYVAFFLPILMTIICVKYFLYQEELNIALAVLCIISIILLMYISASLNYKANHDATFKESANLRFHVIDLLFKMPLRYFKKHDIADISSIIIKDVAALEYALSHSLGFAVAFVIFLVIVCAILMSFSVILTLCILLPLLASVGLMVYSRLLLIKIGQKHYATLREISSDFQSNINLSKDIQSLGVSDIMEKRLNLKLNELEKLLMRVEITQVLPINLAKWITRLSTCLTAIFGILLVAYFGFNIMYLVAFLLISFRFSYDFDELYRNLSALFYLDASVNRLRQLRTFPKDEGQMCNFDNFDIEFKEVNFSYDDKKILNNINFIAKEGEITALIGISGSGKSTIMRLMAGLLKADSGNIFIGQKDISNINPQSIFDNVCMVFQDVILFDDSIFENIKIGKKDASDDEVKLAASMAGCDEMIKRFENGIYENVGENGAKLSAGERQRISIARAFLKNAPIVLLDEITASLDIKNENIIYKSLSKLIKNKTTIIISHRLKSIQNADKIVLIDNGKIDNIGTHEELLKTSEIYKKLLEADAKNAKFSL